MSRKTTNPRALAAQVVREVHEGGRSLDTALARLPGTLPGRDRALVQELAYGTLRWWWPLEAMAAPLLKKPFKPKDHDVYLLILIGLYQLEHLDTPSHAAVSESVAAAAAIGKGWARGVVNACLRQHLRQGAVEGPISDTVRYSHPQWLIETLRTAWPDDWQAVLEANNRRPPMHLRVNLARTTRDDYLARLQAAGIEARADTDVASAIRLEAPCGVERLPGFADGLVSVQDVAAQRAAWLLDPQPEEHVLDACAAPGGKTGHLLEHAPDIRLVALDASAERTRRIDDNLARLGLAATVTVGDARDPGAWWDGEPFDRILLDAPCSATGVIRRHPDIKHLRRPDDLAQLADTQAQILQAMWPLLKQGGKLLYATCSVVPAENDLQIDRMLEDTPDARARPLPPVPGRATPHGAQWLPGDDDTDGFYYCLLQKV